MKKFLILTTSVVALLGVAACAVGHAKGGHGKQGKGQHAARMMEHMDANGDQAISQAEAMDYHESRFYQMDANDDGQVSPEEMQAYRAEKRAAHRAEIEASGDAEKLAKFDARAARHKGKAKRMGKGMMKRADTNGDGALSLDEMMAMHEKRFTKADKNGDGQLTIDELKRGRRHKG